MDNGIRGERRDEGDTDGHDAKAIISKCKLSALKRI
jgi:hypothetical protein